MRVLIATVTAGAGHLQAAAALEEAWRGFRPEDTVERVDVLSFTSKLYRKTYAEGYVKLVDRAPEIYGLVFRKTDNPKLLRKLTRIRRLFARLPASKFIRFVQKFSPDVVVCTHFLPPEILGNLRTKKRRPLPSALVSVVTDFEAHALWTEPEVDLYCVASDETKSRMVARGVPDHKLAVTGIPISARFSAPLDVTALRKGMNLRDDLPVVLVLGGGFGMGPVEEILGELNKLTKPVQVLVVCGRNEALREKLAAMEHRHPTQVLGFVTNMQDLMAVAGLIISKPGGLTSSEALALGQPLLILNPIPGQEAANSDFLLEHGAAAKVNRVEDLPSKLDRLLGSEKLAEMARAARALGRPEAALNVCHEVLNLVQARRTFPEPRLPHRDPEPSSAPTPAPSPPGGKEGREENPSVILYESLGSLSKDGNAWDIDVHGRIFSCEPHPTLERLLQRVLGLKLDRMTADERRLFAQRAKFFLEDSGKQKSIQISAGATSVLSIQSQENGHFAGQFSLPRTLLPKIGPHGGNLDLHASASELAGSAFNGTAYMLPPTGLSVISDLDDTIKATEVPDRRALIPNTFCRPFCPAAGMADVYQAWARDAAASFHYVSASPWQLYPALRDFVRSNGFPSGTFHLRHVRLKDLSALTLLASPSRYKRVTLIPMLLRYPQRQFILVGDTIGADPEIYGELAGRYPQIIRIYLRQPRDLSGMQSRLAKALKRLPSEKWQLFRNASDLPRRP